MRSLGYSVLMAFFYFFSEPTRPDTVEKKGNQKRIEECLFNVSSGKRRRIRRFHIENNTHMYEGSVYFHVSCSIK